MCLVPTNCLLTSRPFVLLTFLAIRPGCDYHPYSLITPERAGRSGIFPLWCSRVFPLLRSLLSRLLPELPAGWLAITFHSYLR